MFLRITLIIEKYRYLLGTDQCFENQVSEIKVPLSETRIPQNQILRSNHDQRRNCYGHPRVCEQTWTQSEPSGAAGDGRHHGKGFIHPHGLLAKRAGSCRPGSDWRRVCADGGGTAAGLWRGGANSRSCRAHTNTRARGGLRASRFPRAMDSGGRRPRLSTVLRKARASGRSGAMCWR